MYNEDLKRFFPDNPNVSEPFDFVRADKDGKIPSDFLPESVKAVIEGYYYDGNFYEDAAHTKLITGEASKIYLDLATNSTYRYTGTLYVLVGDGNLKLYQHNVLFEIEIEDSATSGLTYYFNFISRNNTRLTVDTFLSTLYSIYGQDNFSGTTRGSGSSEYTYANPLGVFIANCGTTGNNLNLKTPAFILVEGEPPTSSIVINNVSIPDEGRSITSVVDTVVEL